MARKKAARNPPAGSITQTTTRKRKRSPAPKDGQPLAETSANSRPVPQDVKETAAQDDECRALQRQRTDDGLPSTRDAEPSQDVVAMKEFCHWNKKYLGAICGCVSKLQQDVQQLKSKTDDVATGEVSEVEAEAFEEDNAINNINETVEGIKETVKFTEKTVAGIDHALHGIGKTTAGIDGTVLGLNQTVLNIDEILQNTDGTVLDINETVNSVDEALKQTDSTVQGIKGTVRNVKQTVSMMKETVSDIFLQGIETKEMVLNIDEMVDDKFGRMEGVLAGISARLAGMEQMLWARLVPPTVGPDGRWVYPPIVYPPPPPQR